MYVSKFIKVCFYKTDDDVKDKRIQHVNFFGIYIFLCPNIFFSKLAESSVYSSRVVELTGSI